MKARIKLVEGMTFIAESGTGHAIVLDASPEIGGRDLGPRPMELVLMGTGACSAIDVMLILRKGRENITDCVCDVSAERAETDPKVFTKIHLHYVITGHQVSDVKVKRAIELSKDKYCSASAMLAKTAEVTYDFVVLAATQPGSQPSPTANNPA